MKTHTEVELKFLVPAGSRAALAAEMGRSSGNLQRISLAAMYLDTPERRLARAGIAWRLRREGRRWVQTLKTGGAGALARFEHEVIRPDATHDAHEHAGTPAGDRLIALVRKAEDRGADVGVRFRTEVRRTARRVRTQGAVVEVAFDEGRLVAGEAIARIREVEFELVSGSVTSMLALAERWRKRFGLILDPRSKAERGDRLAQGTPHPPLRKGQVPDYPTDASAAQAFAAVLDECLAHITHNAIGLAEGDPALQVEQVHQVRVGIRRLRSALRSFQGWTPAPPPALVDGLRTLFGTLGESRDSAVLDSGVAAALAKAGAPPLEMRAAGEAHDPQQVIREADAQRLLLAWIAWRAALDETHDAAGAAPAGDTAPADEPPLRRRAEKRLTRWHARIAARSEIFEQLGEPAIHDLRKRIKRQRYALEFFAPLLPARQLARYLKSLAAIQDRMGELNDLFVARDRYQELLAADPAAWFALGWLAARIAELRARAGSELARLAKARLPIR